LLIIRFMPRSRPFRRFFAARLAVAALLATVCAVACLATACDGGPDDVAPDAHPPRNDVGPCGVMPPIFCFEGAPHRACSADGVTMTCNATVWQCPEGTIVPAECGCSAGPVDGGTAKKPGDACDPASDAGPDANDAKDASDAGDASDASDASDAG
jgi:hypothetical protein